MIALAQLPPRTRRLLSLAGYVVLALVVALVTVLATLPTDRIKDRLETMLSGEPTAANPYAIGMDVTIGELGLTFFTGAGVKLADVQLRTRPLMPQIKPARYVIDDLTVKVGLLGLLFNRPTYRFKAHALAGTINGALAVSPTMARYHIEAHDLALDKAPGLQTAIGLPLAGTVSGTIDLAEPNLLLASSNGVLDLTVDDASVGDGKAKLVVPGDPFLAQGITFPRIKLGHIAGHIMIDKGKASFDTLTVHSADGDASLEGFAELRDPMTMSQVHAYLKFKLSDALVKREPTVAIMNSALGNARRTDGYIGFQMTGQLGALYIVPSRTAPPGVKSSSLMVPHAGSATARLHNFRRGR